MVVETLQIEGGTLPNATKTSQKCVLVKFLNLTATLKALCLPYTYVGMGKFYTIATCNHSSVCLMSPNRGRRGRSLRKHGHRKTSPNGKVEKFSILTSFWPFWGPFWALLCPWNPPNRGGTGQNATKTGPNGPKMRFGAILDHLEATGIHFGPFGKVDFFLILTSFWSFFGHFGHSSHTEPVLGGGSFYHF